MTIQTVLFDFDGTLVDTNELIYQSFVHTFATFGYSFTKEEILAFNGPPLKDTFRKINPQLADEMIKTYRKHNHENHARYIRLFPNVLETLQELKKNNIKIGIVTAKMRVGVELGMKLTNLTPYIDTVISIDDVERPKPHPEPVFKALERLAATKEKTIMVGDNYHDIEAGNRAGVLTAGVAWSHKGEEYLKRYKPTYIIDDMLDLLPIVGV